jgi:ribosomal protein S18 acetylase RimI-like enzyme
VTSQPDWSGIEEIEARGWAEIQQNVSPVFRERFDVRVDRVAGAIMILAPKGDMPALNRVWLPGSATKVTDAALRSIRDHAERVGGKKLIAHCPTWAGDSTLMARHGFELRKPWLKFARRSSSALATDSIRIEEIRSSDGDLFGQIAAAANEAEGWMADGFNSTVGRPGWTHYLAYDATTPIAAAALYAKDDYAWCCFGATLPQHRRKGAQLALLNRRTRDAAVAGIEWIVAEARNDNPASARNMERAGFELIYERPNFTADLTV